MGLHAAPPRHSPCWYPTSAQAAGRQQIPCRPQSAPESHSRTSAAETRKLPAADVAASPAFVLPSSQLPTSACSHVWHPVNDAVTSRLAACVPEARMARPPEGASPRVICRACLDSTPVAALTGVKSALRMWTAAHQAAPEVLPPPRASNCSRQRLCLRLKLCRLEPAAARLRCYQHEGSWQAPRLRHSVPPEERRFLIWPPRARLSTQRALLANVQGPRSGL